MSMLSSAIPDIAARGTKVTSVRTKKGTNSRFSLVFTNVLMPGHPDAYLIRVVYTIRKPDTNINRGIRKLCSIL